MELARPEIEPLEEAQVRVPERGAALAVAGSIAVAERVGERQLVRPQGRRVVTVVRESLVVLVPDEGAVRVDVGTIGPRIAVPVRVDAGEDGERTAGLALRDARDLPAAQHLLEDARARPRNLPDVVHHEAVGTIELRTAPLGRDVEIVLRPLGRAPGGPPLAEGPVVVARQAAERVGGAELYAVGEALVHGDEARVVVGARLRVDPVGSHIRRDPHARSELREETARLHVGDGIDVAGGCDQGRLLRSHHGRRVDVDLIDPVEAAAPRVPHLDDEVRELPLHREAEEMGQGVLGVLVRVGPGGQRIEAGRPGDRDQVRIDVLHVEEPRNHDPRVVRGVHGQKVVEQHVVADPVAAPDHGLAVPQDPAARAGAPGEAHAWRPVVGVLLHRRRHQRAEAVGIGRAEEAERDRG